MHFMTVWEGLMGKQLAKTIIFKIKANVSHYDYWERESLLRRLSPLMPAWNNFLLLCKSLVGIPHGRLRWMWASAQT